MSRLQKLSDIILKLTYSEMAEFSTFIADVMIDRAAALDARDISDCIVSWAESYEGDAE